MFRRARALIFLAVIGAAGLAALFWLPPFAVGLVRTRALPRVEERIGRRVEVAEVKLGWGHVELTDVHIDGGGAPSPLHIPRAIVRFRLFPLLTGHVALTSITLEKPRFAIVRGASGDDNVSSILARLRARTDPGHPEADPGREGGGHTSGPEVVEVRGGTLSVEDDTLGELDVANLQAEIRKDGEGTATLENVDIRLAAGPGAHAARVVARLSAKAGHLDGLPSISVEGGEIHIWKGFAVSGIHGGITPDAKPGRVNIDLSGGYGGVDKDLWSAKGWAMPAAREGKVELVAARFDLGQLAPILSGTPVIDPAEAQVDARLELDYHPDLTSADHLHDALDFEGRVHLAGLSVFHPMLGSMPLRHLGFDASARGTLEPRARTLHLTSSTVDFRGVRATLSLDASKLGKRPAVKGSLVILPVPCQTALAAMPAELVPSLQGFKLAGTFKSEMHLDIDPDDLGAIDLGSKIGIDGCTVSLAPLAVDAGRLSRSFSHAVEVEPGSWLMFPVGPERPDWVPIADISPNLINSIMTTEDSTFLQHKGFIGREFKSALRTNLEHGSFRLGASSITMQMVKNVLLSREKTLSRKLQEMFLTWYLERHLSKERILEIYFNVIEFGPGIYGIGRASHHYFGKSAKDLLPREAAFFSSILPNPKRRYVHYCKGPALDQKWETYLNRILRRMHERARLTDVEYAAAMESKLRFDITEAQPVEKCLEMVRHLSAAQQQGGSAVADRSQHIPIPLGPLGPLDPATSGPASDEDDIPGEP